MKRPVFYRHTAPPGRKNENLNNWILLDLLYCTAGQGSLYRTYDKLIRHSRQAALD